MELSLRNKIIVAVVGVVLIALIVVAVIATFGGTKNEAQPGTTGTSTATVSPSGTGSSTQLPLPANVIVPEAGSTSTNGVAVPQVEAPAATGSNSKYRSFNLTVQNGKFAPDTIAVNLGDVVSIQLTSMGGSYDFTQPDYGLSATVPVGGTRKIQFGALSSGKFVFYCASCGGPEKGPVGYIIINNGK